MFKHGYTTIRYTAIACLALVFALSAAWAINYYSASRVIRKGEGGSFKVVNQGSDWALIQVKGGSLDAYMDDRDVDEVKITVTMTEELIERDDGSTYYRLDFYFGESDAYFYPDPLTLKIKGKYVASDTEVGLYNADEEELESTRDDKKGKMIFEISNLATGSTSYYYDRYY